MAFEMLEECTLFHLFYTFCELKINDHSEGICMVVERPEDWAINKKDSPLLIRRGYNHVIDKKESGKKIEKTEADKYIDNFRQIYRSLNNYKGEELLKKLSDLLDMDAYMKWMAFNLLVRNGDYTDEVFFYVDPGSKKFGVIPWDYDDLFSAKPHEAIVDNSNPKRDKLIFSYEDVLDKRIADDPYLYNVYMVQVKEVLNKLSPEVMKRVFENTYSELYPYFSDKEIIGNSRFDLYKDANLETLKDDLISSYHRLIISRNYFLNYLESRIK
jgi:spore coat protein H